MSNGKVLLALMAGVATGALLGVLFAPNKGSDTRKKITRKGEDISDELKSKFDEFMEVLSRKADDLKEEGKEWVKKGKNQFEEMVGEAEKAAS